MNSEITGLPAAMMVIREPHRGQGGTGKFRFMSGYLSHKESNLFREESTTLDWQFRNRTASSLQEFNVSMVRAVMD